MAPDGISGSPDETRLPPDIVRLLHRLNNQLGVILANAELLESKLPDDAQRVRATQVVTGALEAIGTVQHLKHAMGSVPAERAGH